MLNFLKSILSTVLGMVIGFFLILFIGLGIIVALSEGDGETIVKENSILKITLSDPIIDRGSDNPIDFDILSMESKNKMGLTDILNSIEKAKTDDRIKGIYMNVEMPNASLASLEEIREKLLEFKSETDKFIIAYSEIYSQKAYYITSVADEVYLHPEGILEFVGLAYQGMFYKGALEKLDIEPQIIRHGKFKAAVEPYMLDKMSDENRQQITKFLKSIWSNMLADISESRKISTDELFQIVQQFKVRKASDAVTLGLIDANLYKDQVLDSLRQKLNIEADEKIEVTGLAAYKNVKLEENKKKYSKDKIAIIYAYGEISGGEGDDENIGSERISRAIRDARTDEKVKAIVLRVNSPGGSALASETILREMILAKAEKPIVVSMGDVAASGGYYIACHADTIVANPTTITGSIGVFGLLMNTQKLMKNKLGITIDTVRTNKYADMGSMFRSLTIKERNIIQKSVEDIYDTFITHVSEGRSMSKEAVDAIGQGRVWTGTDARDLGLVDVLGGFEDAIDLAANMANLENYRISYLPKKIDPMEELIKDLTGGAKVSILENELGESYQLYKEINNILEMDEVQMRMPYFFEIN
ncbi:MAG: signal peptide peptidase SppA [Flavobacteriales bacterium]|nr:signal peptide peptidase SppA [Flavobacteriales bacterium]|tara:strand:+ start:22141 stop:23907 length:1767 start_codon:yes stop_codon:yes gene_type:complete